MKKRQYRLKQRAEQQQETRERIVDAAVALHEEIGPAATTISALAERAGVQRLTVYRHFANEAEILGACSSKWFGAHPPPDVSRLTRETADDTTRAVLHALYSYYRETQGMWRSLYGDVGKMDELDAPMSRFEAYLGIAGDVVLESWAARPSKRLRAAVGHAVRFSTWQSLDAQKLGPKAMAALVGSWIRASAGVDTTRDRDGRA